MITIDPKRSLAAGVMWLIISLAATFSVAAAMWVGSIARANILEQHFRRLALETDQLGSNVGQAVASRLEAIRAVGTLLPDAAEFGPRSNLGEVFKQLKAAYPEFAWIAIADSSGVIGASDGTMPQGINVLSLRWFESGMQGPWLGIGTQVEQPASALAAPLRNSTGRIVGVVAAGLSWQSAPKFASGLTDGYTYQGSTASYIIDRNGIILLGPDHMRGTRWMGVAINGGSAVSYDAPQFQRLPDGQVLLVSQSPLRAGGQLAALGWRAQLSETNERVYQRADALARKILWVSLLLGAATAVLGILGTQHLTRRLTSLTRSVSAVGRHDSRAFDIPPGRDEVAQLARVFARVLDDLRLERSELKALTSDLEHRVAMRTREIVRLAEESRYSAVVRERLKIARDLHDTLAHSMMALLSEIRFLRKLHKHDPAAVSEELAHAEEVAHEGLKEARNAISQMRFDAVRDTGLGPALRSVFDRFIDRTGLTGDFTEDANAGRLGDVRAETLLRMAQEALRNIEKHAAASHIIVSLTIDAQDKLELRVRDNGVGFEPKGVCPEHYGLIGLGEQADLIGAVLRIDSSAELGTTVIVTMPLSPLDQLPPNQL